MASIRLRNVAWGVVGVLLLIIPGAWLASGGGSVHASHHEADRPALDRFESEIAAFEASDREHPPEPGRILFTGSSSIRLWKKLPEDFPHLEVLNRGFGGSTLAEAIHYVGRIVAPYKPSRIVLYEGDNDLAQGLTPDEVLADFDRFVTRVREALPDVPIDFIAIKPSPSRQHLWRERKAANARVRAYAKDHLNVGFIDIASPMLGDDGKPRPELFGRDRLHMNSRGYALWADVIGKYLEKAGVGAEAGAGR